MNPFEEKIETAPASDGISGCYVAASMAAAFDCILGYFGLFHGCLCTVVIGTRPASDCFFGYFGFFHGSLFRIMIGTGPAFGCIM